MELKKYFIIITIHYLTNFEGQFIKYFTVIINYYLYYLEK